MLHQHEDMHGTPLAQVPRRHEDGDFARARQPDWVNLVRHIRPDSVDDERSSQLVRSSRALPPRY